MKGNSRVAGTRKAKMFARVGLTKRSRLHALHLTIAAHDPLSAQQRDNAVQAAFARRCGLYARGGVCRRALKALAAEAVRLRRGALHVPLLRMRAKRA